MKTPAKTSMKEEQPDQKAGPARLGGASHNFASAGGQRRTGTAMNVLGRSFDFANQLNSADLFMVSQKGRERKRSKHYQDNVLHAVSVQDRRELFERIRRGQNGRGGTFGGNAPDREPSPSLLMSKKKGPNAGRRTYMERFHDQRFQHSQGDPILVRGHQNVDYNHLAIRKKEFR